MRTASCSSPRPATVNRSGRIAPIDGDGDVRPQFLFDALAQLAGGDILAFPASERAVVDHEHHGDGRRLDGQQVEADGPLGVGDGIADGHGGDAREGEELPGLDGGHRGPFQSLEDEQLLDLSENLLVPPGQDHDRVAGPDPAAQEAADADAPDIVVVADVGDQRRRGGSRDRIPGPAPDPGWLEERRQVPRRLGQVRRRRAVPARGVDDRENPLLVVGARAR